MPTLAELKAAHDMLVANDKAVLAAFVADATELYDKLTATLANLPEPSPSSPTSQFIDKIAKNTKGGIDEATYLLGLFPKDDE